MKLSKTTKISIRIVALFITAMLMSFIPDLFPDFFGDWTCIGTTGFNRETVAYTGCVHGGYSHSPEVHWGYRHFLYFFMGLSLAMVQVVDIVNFISKDE